jgi:6-phosphogluconolactonase
MRSQCRSELIIPEVRILPDASALAQTATEHILDACLLAIHLRGVANLALAGGETPRLAYTLLSQPEYASRMDWSRMQIYWSDERLVPPDHTYSNYRLAAEVLLRRVPIPQENIHRMHGELPPYEAAQAYEDELRRCLPAGEDGFPCFDLMMVGMGDDGHIASLFPGAPALLEHQRWIVASEHNQPPPPLVPRLSLTLPVINASAQVLLMVSGEKKAETLRQVLEDVPGSEPLPAQLIKPRSGKLVWLIDAPAASRLTKKS